MFIIVVDFPLPHFFFFFFFQGALTTLAVGHLSIDWSVYGEPVIAVISLFEGAMLFVAGNTDILWITYATYIAFCLSYRILITIARLFSDNLISWQRKNQSFIFHNSQFGSGQRTEARKLRIHLWI